MAASRTNERYLPGTVLPAGITLEADFAVAARVPDIVLAVPSHAFRATLERLRAVPGRGRRLAWATKGFEQDTGLLPHAVAATILGSEVPTAVLSGPTFAREVALGLPTALTVASTDSGHAHHLATSISSARFRAYTSTDIVGVEVGGAVKNVLAIATGMADGMGFGANTRSALITRGLAEMTRLGLALGARPETFMGLAGLGDLVLTCTDDQSRNRRFGLSIARGASAEEAHAQIGQVVEGVRAAQAVRGVAAAQGVEMPITAEVHAVLYEQRPLRDAVANLMRRGIRAEADAGPH
jgi:glycerol-3-phosphate dehydrogenase (NAD(P)+)